MQDLKKNIEQRQQSPTSLGGGFPIEKAISGEIQSPTDVVQSPRKSGARRCNLRELMPDSFRQKRLTEFEGLIIELASVGLFTALLFALNIVAMR